MKQTNKYTNIKQIKKKNRAIKKQKKTPPINKKPKNQINIKIYKDWKEKERNKQR